MGGNAYIHPAPARANRGGGDKQGRQPYGPSPLSALASLGFGTEEDNSRTTYEKQLAMHVLVLSLCCQLIALMGFQSVIPVALEATFIFLLSVGTLIAYVVTKDHKAIRGGLLISGALYVITFFFAQGCTPVTTSGGRVWVLVLPTVLLHVTLGGDLLTQVAACVGHLAFFLLVAGLEAGGVKCYDPSLTGAVTNSLALTAVEVVLPVILVIALIAYDAHRTRAFTEETNKSEEFAKTVLRSLLKHDFAATTTAVNEYDATAVSLSFSDEAIISSMQAINELDAMVPSHLKEGAHSPGGGNSMMVVHEIKRKNSVPNLNTGMNPPTSSNTPPPQGDAPTPNITFVQAFGEPNAESEEGAHSSDHEHDQHNKSGRASPYPSPNPNPPGAVNDGDTDEDPFTPQHFLSSRNSKSPNKSPSDHDGLELIVPNNNVRKASTNSGSNLRKFSNASGFDAAGAVTFLGDSDGKVPPQNLRRRQSMSSHGKFSSLMVLEPSFIVVFALPRMTGYATRSIANLDLLKLVFDEFADNAKKATDLYDGRLLWHSFTQIYAKFPDVFTAICAALAFEQLMKVDAKHYLDHHMLEAKAHLPFVIVLHAHVLSGIVGTQPAAMASMGASTADHVVSRILDTVAMQDITPPAVVAPLNLQIYLEDEFSFCPEEHTGLMILTGSKHTNPDGLPKCVSDPPYINIHNTEITNFESMVKEIAAKLVESGTRELAASGNTAALSPRSQRGAKHFSISMGESDNSLPFNDESTEQMPSHQGSARASLRGSHRASSAGASSKRDRHNKRLPPEVLDMWNEFDADRNGYLDREEVREVLLEMGIQMTEEEQRVFFDSVDADKSGTVTLDEFHKAFFSSTLGGSNVMSHIRRAATAMARNTGDNLPVVLNAWKKYDADGSGSLEPEELRLVLKDLGMEQTEEEVLWLVDYMDKNGNGSIEFDEFAALFSEDNVANVRLNIVKERIQTVSRVMANKSSGKTYSNAEQTERDKLTTLDKIVETLFVLPIFAYIVYNSGLNLFRAAMGTDMSVDRTHMYVDLVIDYLIYGVWVGLKLGFLPREVGGQVIWKRKDVILSSVKSLDFWLDIIVLLPLDVIYFSLTDDEAALVTIGYFRLNKCMSMVHFDSQFLILSSVLSPPMQRVANALSYFITFAHIFGCALILVARDVGGENIADMIGTTELLLPERRGTLFLKAFYWAMLTMAGQLKGEPVPAEDKGLYLATAGCLVGLPMFTIILGTVGNAVNVEDSEARFLSKLDDLRGYFSYTKMPLTIENECVAYYRHLFNTTGTLDILDNPLGELPVELTVQVTVEIGIETLKKVPIFKEACENLEFVHELTSKLVPRVLEPDQIIMKKGDRGSNMYFLTFGEANVMTDPGPTGFCVFTFKAGGFFGEIALLHGGKRTATLRVGKKRYANVLTLDKEKFEEVAETFPQSFSSIHKAAADRIKQIKEKEEEDKKAEKEKRRLEKEAERKEKGEEGKEGNIDDDDDELNTTERETTRRNAPNMLAMIRAQSNTQLSRPKSPQDEGEESGSPPARPQSAAPAKPVLPDSEDAEDVAGVPAVVMADEEEESPLQRNRTSSTAPAKEASFNRPFTPGFHIASQAEEEEANDEEGLLGETSPTGEGGPEQSDSMSE